MTPEDLARTTVGTLDEWRHAQHVLGDLFQGMFEQVATDAAVFHLTPADVADRYADILTRLDQS